jgi:preprotein translocase subunit Sec63
MEDSMTYRELKDALKTFGITERATLEQIKQRHRELVKMHHPDQNVRTKPEMIRKVNDAYEIITTYCAGYRYCFSEEEFLEQNPGERLRRQFGWDPLWGGKPEEE